MVNESPGLHHGPFPELQTDAEPDPALKQYKRVKLWWLFVVSAAWVCVLILCKHDTVNVITREVQFTISRQLPIFRTISRCN